MKLLLLIALACFTPQINTGIYRVPKAMIINTAFNEGSVGAGIVGTSPAVNAHGNLWVNWPTATSLTFKSGGGAGNTGSTFQGNVIDTGATAYTVTWTGVTNLNGTFFTFSASDATVNNRIGISLLGAGGVQLIETVGGGSTTVGTQGLTNGATGSIVAVANGTSLTVTVLGNAPMTYTIPGGNAEINGRFVGGFVFTNQNTIGGMTVTVP